MKNNLKQKIIIPIVFCFGLLYHKEIYNLFFNQNNQDKNIISPNEDELPTFGDFAKETLDSILHVNNLGTEESTFDWHEYNESDASLLKKFVGKVGFNESLIILESLSYEPDSVFIINNLSEKEYSYFKQVKRFAVVKDVQKILQERKGDCEDLARIYWINAINYGREAYYISIPNHILLGIEVLNYEYKDITDEQRFILGGKVFVCYDPQVGVLKKGMMNALPDEVSIIVHKEDGYTTKKIHIFN